MLDSLQSLKQIEHPFVRQPARPDFIRQQPLPAPYKKDLPSQKNSAVQSSICYDTSRRFFLKNDSFALYTTEPYKTKDGNVLIPGGYAAQYEPYRFTGFLMKCDLDGNVIWAHQYDSANLTAKQFGNYSYVIELRDGSLVLAGRFTNPATENEDIVITKTDSYGNIIWNKAYKSRLWARGNSSASYFVIEDIRQDPYSGDLFMSGGFWQEGRCLTRINQNTGAIIWSNFYQYSNNGYQIFDRSFGVDFLSDEIRFFGKFGAGHTFISVHRINRTNGDIIQSKLFKADDPDSWKLEFLQCEQLKILNNGNYILSGSCYDSYPVSYDPPTRPLAQVAVVELDRDLNFVSAYAFKNQVQSNSYNTRVTAFPDGSGLFTMLNWKGNYDADVFYVQYKDGFITRQRKRAYNNEGIPAENTAIKLPDGGDMAIKLLYDNATSENKVEFLKLHTSDTSSACLGYDDVATFIYPFKYVQDTYPLDSVGRNALQENPERTLTAADFTMQLLPGCYQVSHCDSLKLSAAKTTICLGETLSLIARKNPECGTLVPFNYNSTAIQSAKRENDSTVSFQFNQPWSGYMYASLKGCDVMSDSVFIQVLKAPAALSLGADTVICPGNSIQLNARAGYASYRWQDGSVDSVFTVSLPGKYYVTTTDACGGNFSDTVLVADHPPISLDLGADRTKCNSDTVQLKAPSGFINYYWSNNYNINSLSSQNVIVAPLTDTAYFLKAEKSPGCFAYDTIHIKVYRSPAIYLGNDTSFCAGHSVLLTIPGSFASYQWSTGAASNSIIVKNAGTFSVTATTSEGCKSEDTLVVTNVFPNPVVDLDKKTELCEGSSKVLDAGVYNSYLWQDGSASRRFTVFSTGKYYVEVLDAHGCKGADTTAITTILPLPHDFLPEDTAICSYGTLVLKPRVGLSKYNWSTGATSPSITISTPGIYSLQATDIKGCSGKDSMTVFSRECLEGLYVPNAFTPNGDGKNDFFKALLFGNVKSFELTLYDRWGGIIFQTKDRFKGWDGKRGGIEQSSATYIWMCKYQLEGQEVKMQKGTVMLIK